MRVLKILGLPAKRYSEPIIQAFVEALDSIISQGMKPLSAATAANN
jgi:hypothetical protein